MPNRIKCSILTLRRDGNTQALIRHVLAVVAAEGIDTEPAQPVGTHIRGCRIALEDNPFILFI